MKARVRDDPEVAAGTLGWSALGSNSPTLACSRLGVATAVLWSQKRDGCKYRTDLEALPRW
jgi:hypothetical protein